MSQASKRRKIETAPGVISNIMFRVDDVKNEAQPLKEVDDFFTAVQTRLNGKTVECAGLEGKQHVVHVKKSNGLFDAIGYAYANHFPLELRPSDIHLALCQAFGVHVNENSERLRAALVIHEGKQEIKIRRDNFIKGSKDNQWSECFPEFVQKISKFTKGEINDIYTTPYSTSTPTDVAASQITLMSALKDYFSYSCSTLCGIPSIMLKGSSIDWTNLQQRMRRLATYDPEFQWWFNIVDEMLQEFCNASNGSIDPEFWSNIFKIGGGSGGPYISGWITVLFPYAEDLSGGMYLSYTNDEVKCLADVLGMKRRSPSIVERSVPAGLASAPFKWYYLSQTYDMEFVAGFMGMCQNPDTLAIYPCVGWAVVDTNTIPEAVKRRELLIQLDRLHKDRQEKTFGMRDALPYTHIMINGEYYYPPFLGSQGIEPTQQDIDAYKNNGFDEWYASITSTSS
jgi:hypothetical protein